MPSEPTDPCLTTAELIGQYVRVLRCEAREHGDNVGCVCHLIGGVERIAKRYDTPFAGTASYHLLGRPQRVRMSEVEIVQVSANDQTTAILDLPTPLVSVTPSGIFVEWHARGLDIEVRVRSGSVYIDIADARGEVPHYSGNVDGSVRHALAALEVMEKRDE